MEQIHLRLLTWPWFRDVRRVQEPPRHSGALPTGIIQLPVDHGRGVRADASHRVRRMKGRLRHAGRGSRILMHESGVVDAQRHPCRVELHHAPESGVLPRVVDGRPRRIPLPFGRQVHPLPSLHLKQLLSLLRRLAQDKQDNARASRLVRPQRHREGVLLFRRKQLPLRLGHIRPLQRRSKGKLRGPLSVVRRRPDLQCRLSLLARKNALRQAPFRRQPLLIDRLERRVLQEVVLRLGVHALQRRHKPHQRNERDLRNSPYHRRDPPKNDFAAHPPWWAGSCSFRAPNAGTYS